MKYQWRLIVLGILMAAFGETPATAQQAMSTADMAKVKAEVSVAEANYIRVFSAKDIRTVVDKVWAHPAVEMGPGGAKLLTPADVEENYKKIYAGLAKTAWDHSEGTSVVCVISPTMAVSRNHFRRLTKDGALLMEGYSHYLYTKQADGWRITTSLGNQLKDLKCD